MNFCNFPKSSFAIFCFHPYCCVLFILISVISRLWSKVLRAAVLWGQGSRMLAIPIIQFQNHPASSSYQAVSRVVRNMTSHPSVFPLQLLKMAYFEGNFERSDVWAQVTQNWIKWLSTTLMARSGTKI